AAAAAGVRGRVCRGHRRHHRQPARRARTRHRPVAAVPAAGHRAGADRRGGGRAGRRPGRGAPGRRRPRRAAPPGRGARARPALRCAAALGGGLAWAGPVGYLVAGVYALYTQWHGPALTTPWLWPARPPHDLGAVVCAGLVFAVGLAVITVRGARDPAGEEARLPGPRRGGRRRARSAAPPAGPRGDRAGDG